MPATLKLNSEPKPAKQPRKARATAKPKPDADLHRTACLTVWTCAALSAVLNGYSASQHAPIPVMGWLLGLTIPAIVLLLGRVSGKLWKRGNKPLAYFAGGSGVGLLVLSVYHCAESISLLTGSGLILSVPMAIAIDAGMTASELAAISES